MRLVMSEIVEISPKTSQRTIHIEAFATSVTEIAAAAFFNSFERKFCFFAFLLNLSMREDKSEYQLTSPNVDKNESQNETDVADPGISRMSAPASDSEVSASPSRDSANERYAKRSINTDRIADAENPERKRTKRATKENNTHRTLFLM